MNVTHLPRAPHLAEPPGCAEAWFARLHSPDCTAADRASFGRWIGDNANAAAYAACERVAAMSAEMRSHHALLNDLLADAGVSDAPLATPARQRIDRRAVLAIAATLAVVAIGVQLAYQSRNPTPSVATTGRGQQTEVALADGSRVQLNTDTVVEWRLTDKERRVDLKRGEAYFDVRRDPRRPFVVRTASTEVRVVGTKFSVREEGGKVQVFVKEGQVDVVPDSTRPLGSTPTKVELTPGKRLTYDGTQHLVRVALIDPERSLAWRSGSLDFDAATLEEAVAEINRYAAKPLFIEDERLRGVRLSGRFRLGDVEAVGFALRERFGIEAIETGDRIALRSH